MSDQNDSANANSPQWEDGTERPLSLVEVFVAEYEQQSEQKSETRANLPLLSSPYESRDAIIKKCNQIAAEAGEMDGTEDDQQKFFCRKTDELAEGFYRELHAQQVKRAALCISGGGIRSATFALGLMQGLTRSGVELSKIHYLSTVSGGGYIGSWLSAWIHRQGVKCVQEALPCSAPDAPPATHAPAPQPPPSAAPAQTILCSDADRSPLAPEPTTIRHLRRYSNYMSPKVGVLSADTWTLVGIFLRNLLLNWLVLIPLLVAALAVPRLAVSAACWNYPDNNSWVEQVAIILAFIAGVISVAYQVVNLPSWRQQSRIPESWKTEKAFLWLCWLPVGLAAFLSAAYWSWVHIPANWSWNWWIHISAKVPPRYSFDQNRPLAFILFGALFHVAGYLIARLIFIKIRGGRTLIAELIDFSVRALTGALGGLCLWMATLAFPLPVQIDRPLSVEKQSPAG